MSPAAPGAAAGALHPWSGTRLAWAELVNKLAAYRRFRTAGSVLPHGLPLARAARAALALGPRRAPWVLEGLGYARTEAAWRGGEPRELLGQAADGSLPRESLLPLHTGMGLSLARRSLDGLGRRPAGSPARSPVERFRTLVRANALPGYEGAVLEALGLVARLLHRRHMEPLAAAAAAAEPGLSDRLWHGAGRGLYFAPVHVLPVLDPVGRALRAAVSEPDHPAGRANGVAGVAWALTLVNLHRPEVVARALESVDETRINPIALRQGVTSALLLRWHVVGRDADLEAFLRYAPAGPPSPLSERWERLVRRPAEDALARRGPQLRAGIGVGDLFRVEAPAPRWSPRDGSPGPDRRPGEGRPFHHRAAGR